MKDKNINGKKEIVKKFAEKGYSLQGYSPVYIIEIILHFSTKNRSDEELKKLAEDLINNFGDVQNFLFSDRNSLQCMGLSEDEMDNIAFMAALFRRMCVDDYQIPLEYSDRDMLERYLKAIFRFELVEKLYLFPVKNQKIVDCRYINEGIENSLSFNINNLIKVLEDYPDCHEYILAHNHPRNFCKPSATDISSTKLIAGKLRLLGYELVAHYTVGIDGVDTILQDINYLQYLFGADD